MRNNFRLPFVLLGSVFLAHFAAATPPGTVTPCGVSAFPARSANGLTPVEAGSVVYDANQGLCWLADANLAGHPEVRAAVPLSPLNPDGSTPLINPDGAMDYETALNWVGALN